MTAPPPVPPPASKRNGLIVFALYCVLFFWLNRSWITDAADSVVATSPAGLPDARLIVWVLDWMSYCLRGECAALIDAPINYPEPAQLTGSEHFATSQLLFSPLYWATRNPLQAANYTTILTYPITAYAMYALLTALGISLLPAFAAGLTLALGPMQAPGNLHILQYLPTFFPIVALALTRLRHEPSAGRTLLCAVAFFAGVMSSYYTAMMLMVVYLLWVAIELVAPAGRRARFIICAGGAFVGPLLVLLAASSPYMSRVGDADQAGFDRWSWDASWIMLKSIRMSFSKTGAVTVAAALLGLLGLVERDLRRLVGGAILLWLAGTFLSIGGAQLLYAADLSGVLGELASLPGRFFRLFSRGIVISGFAFSLLVGIGLETLKRRTSRTGAALAAAVVAAVVVTRGPVLSASVIEPVEAFRNYRSDYESVGRVIRERGGGPLVELPRSDGAARRDSQAMMGQLIHRAPLIVGHSGYQPASRKRVDRWVRRLPRAGALDDLMRTTGLRWILLRPQQDWHRPMQRSEFRRVLDSHPAHVATHRLGVFVLIELEQPA